MQEGPAHAGDDSTAGNAGNIISDAGALAEGEGAVGHDGPLMSFPVQNGRHVRKDVPSSKCGLHFFVPGTRKGGTTSMYTWIAQHPDVVGLQLNGKPTDGEINAFRKNPTRAMLLKTYGKAEKMGKITGESTVSYLEQVEHSIGRIKKLCGGGVRFILMLRDPIERARSLFLMRVRLGTWRRCPHVARPANFTELVQMDIANTTNPFGHCTEFIESAKYAAKVRDMLRYFPPSQIMVVFTEQLHEHAAAILNQAFEFLGLDPTKASAKNITARRYNAARPSGKTPSPHSVLSKDVEAAMCAEMLSSNRDLAALLNLTVLPWKTCGIAYHHHDGG